MSAEKDELLKGGVGQTPDEPPIPTPRPDELPAVVEALLFATTTPLTLPRLVELTGNSPEELIVAAIGDIRARHEVARSGLMLMEVAGGWQLATRVEVAEWVLALHKHRRKNPISPAVMETLAIVAYKQPIVRAEIEAIRGVDCGGVLRSLQDAGLIEVVGTKEVAGRPSLYGTADNFLKTFGLRELSDLPSLADLQHILAAKMRGPEGEAVKAEPEGERQNSDAAVAPQAEPAAEASKVE